MRRVFGGEWQGTIRRSGSDESKLSPYLIKKRPFNVAFDCVNILINNLHVASVLEAIRFYGPMVRVR